MNVKKPTIQVLHENKKALFDYEVLKDYEAGIKLSGYEVKSIRNKHCNLKGSYVSLQSGRPYLKGFHVSPYKEAFGSHLVDPDHDRELFIHKKEIIYLSSKLKEKGFSLIPLEVYLKGNLIKIKIALAKGRKSFEKKQVLKERDVNREMQRAIKEY